MFKITLSKKKRLKKFLNKKKHLHKLSIYILPGLPVVYNLKVLPILDKLTFTQWDNFTALIYHYRKQITIPYLI